MAEGASQVGPDDNPEVQGDQYRGQASNMAPTREPYTRSSAELAPGEDPPSKGPGPSAVTVDASHGDYAASHLDNREWLIQQAHEMYNYSTDYLDANITNFWERSLAHFHNEHAPGTVYRRKDFKRSRVFRPKTRANIKAQESSLANALFSTLNLVSIEAENENDQMQTLSAKINQVLLQKRLENTIPWFLTVQGAYQNTKVYGLCISHQYWKYEEDTDIVPAFGDDGKLIFDKDESGESVAMGYEETIVRKDEPAVDLIEPENFRFDPMCDWRDPANTSPYIVLLVPTYAGEALEMMEKKDPKTGRPAWIQHTLGELLGTRRQDYDRTRQAREGRERIDPADEQHGNEFTTLWAHLNILKINGTDWAYWTMGTEILLTKPQKLTEMYPHLREGERPFTVGFSTVESHRNYPSGDVEQTSQLQEEINLVANQRLDNVKLVLNKRYYVRRGSQVDLDALIRNTPGGGVMMNDPEKDVLTINTPDVTSSSYTEQAALSSEFDELAGGFNPATAQQKSVGGMTMAGASANSVQDYGIKIFIETWVEPVLRQLVRIEQMYETDETILALAADKTEAYKQGLQEIPSTVLQQNLTVRVDVAMGNTDPMRRVERLVFATGKVAELPGMAMRIKGDPIAQEIYGSLGYRDATKFVMTDDEWAAYLEENPQGPSEMDVKMRELEIREEDNRMRDEREREKADKEFGQRTEDRFAKDKMKQDELDSRERLTDKQVQAQREKADKDDRTKRDTAAIGAIQKTRDSNVKQTGGSK